ncbi:hypothetical protein DERP_007416, partial [Dermatophagoides pteronyssinus]
KYSQPSTTTKDIERFAQNIIFERNNNNASHHQTTLLNQTDKKQFDNIEIYNQNKNIIVDSGGRIPISFGNYLNSKTTTTIVSMPSPMTISSSAS